MGRRRLPPMNGGYVFGIGGPTSPNRIPASTPAIAPSRPFAAPPSGIVAGTPAPPPPRAQAAGTSKASSNFEAADRPVLRYLTSCGRRTGVWGADEAMSVTQAIIVPHGRPPSVSRARGYAVSRGRAPHEV